MCEVSPYDRFLAIYDPAYDRKVVLRIDRARGAVVMKVIALTS